jgi:hypothetical protein
LALAEKLPSKSLQAQLSLWWSTKDFANCIFRSTVTGHFGIVTEAVQ